MGSFSEPIPFLIPWIFWPLKPVACVPAPPLRGSRKVASEIPQPLSVTLTKMGEPIARGAHGDVYKGIWDPPSAQVKQVVIKCLRLRDETQSEFTERVKLYYYFLLLFG